MDIHEQDSGDYVLVHKTKAKISRARKAVMGVMAIGAVAVLTNAGTFASFSATTSNDASFKTGRLVLSNTKQSGTACFSSGDGVDGLEDDAFLDDNETTCDALFANNLKPGTTATAGLTLTNGSTGDYIANLSVYSISTCTDEKVSPTENAGSANLCDAVELVIQETDSSFANPVCVYPTAEVCAFDNDGVGTIADFISDHPFGSRLSLATNVAVGSSKYYVVSVRLGSAGGFSSTGIGLDNKYMNKKANLALTWHLTEA